MRALAEQLGGPDEMIRDFSLGFLRFFVNRQLQYTP